MLLGGIEGGGTKYVCAVADEQGTLLHRTVIPTTNPETTLDQVISYFKEQEAARGEKLTTIGIGSFGPVDLQRGSPHYGYITSTPKAGWQYADVVGPIKAAFPGIPVGFDTDVNTAALGEHHWGAAQNWDTFIYLTVGTGIGGGGMLGGRLMHGLIHPEMGHVLLPKHPDDPLARGVCPFHPNCLEGLASGPALKARWGVSGETLPVDHQAWEIEAYYLATAVMDFLCTCSPQGVILGGSVMHQKQLFPLVRKEVFRLVNHYLVHPRMETLEDLIVPPALGDDAGVKGAIALGRLAMDEAERGADI